MYVISISSLHAPCSPMTLAEQNRKLDKLIDLLQDTRSESAIGQMNAPGRYDLDEGIRATTVHRPNIRRRFRCPNVEVVVPTSSRKRQDSDLLAVEQNIPAGGKPKHATPDSPASSTLSIRPDFSRTEDGQQLETDPWIDGKLREFSGFQQRMFSGDV